MIEASDYAKAVAERDEAIVLGQSRVIQPPAQGGEVRLLASLHLRALRGLRSLARRIGRRRPMQ